MKYSEIAEKLKQIACVVCVDLSDSDKNGTITLEAANTPYLASVNKLDEKFVPGREYTYYINRDPNFEKNCIKCVTTGKAVHQYVNAELYNAWIDIYFHPLVSDDDQKGYILFSYEMTQRADSEKLLDISGSTASHVLKTCIKLREADDFQLAMDSIIIDIRRLCDASGCCILLTDFEARKCSVLCVDHDDSFNPGKGDIIFRPEFFNIVDTWRDLMAGSNCYIISDKKDFKEVKKKNAEWADSLIKSGVKNLVLYPLRANGMLLGYIWATNFNSDKIDFIKEVMELNAFILSAEIANHKMVKKLEVLSTTDMLTGAFNRNAMNTRISEIVSGAKKIENNYGVIIVDVNGLKVVNDKEGHHKGDYLIKDVCDILLDIFKDYEVYRAGGDEFFIFVTNCEEKKFKKLLDKLKKSGSGSSKVRFAIGYYYDEGPEYNIKQALQQADSNMYKDKAAYYKSNPKLDRRTR